MNKDIFSSYHPIVNFIFFILVLVCTMFFMHPVSQLISLACGIVYAAYLNGASAVRFSVRIVLPMMIMAAIINPAFNHKGTTILTYLPSGNPVTLESILYGLAAAVMLASVIVWFFCYNALMTSDKFIYLFGRVIPSLSLVFSMTLRFVPMFRAQLHMVSEAQRCLGRDIFEGNIIWRIKKAITVISILFTWSLENAIETADSMKSRGYGLPGRTAFSIYRFDNRDKIALVWLCFCGVSIIAGWILGSFGWQYYPVISGAGGGFVNVSFQLIYMALCFTPVIMNLTEDRKWKSLKYRT